MAAIPNAALDQPVKTILLAPHSKNKAEDKRMTHGFHTQARTCTVTKGGHGQEEWREKVLQSHSWESDRLGLLALGNIAAERCRSLLEMSSLRTPDMSKASFSNWLFLYC